MPSDPTYLFTDTITGCPLIDDSIYPGIAKRKKQKKQEKQKKQKKKDMHGCGFNGKSFNCDFWNLTEACSGSAAGEPGSEAMIAVCDKLCDLVDGCDGSMLDHSFDENSGLCTLHTGTPVLTEACFFYSSAFDITNEASCAATSAIAAPKDAQMFAVDGGAGRMGILGKQGGTPGDGACERDTPRGSRKTHAKVHAKNTDTTAKKTKKSTPKRKDKKSRDSKEKSKGSNGDAGAAGAAPAFRTTASREFVVGVAVAAMVLLTLGLGMALRRAGRPYASSVTGLSAEGLPEGAARDVDLTWDAAGDELEASN